MSNPARTLQPAVLDLRPLHPRLGAELGGLHLAGSLDAAIVAALKAALLRHKVLFIRAQDHLDDAEHERFGALLGDVVRHPAANHPTNINLIDGRKSWGRANHWHSDATFKAAYPRATVIRAVDVPPTGGATLWANTVTAYQDLPAPLQALADGLRAVHSNMGEFMAYRMDADTEENRRFGRMFQSNAFYVEHPVVRVIAETGERALLLSGYFKHIVGVSRDDSRSIHEMLQRSVTRPENILAWNWRPGDVAIWENRTTQHYATDNYGDFPRMMHSVQLNGDVPVGVDGVSSKVLEAP